MYSSTVHAYVFTKRVDQKITQTAHLIFISFYSVERNVGNISLLKLSNAV